VSFASGALGDARVSDQSATPIVTEAPNPDAKFGYAAEVGGGKTIKVEVGNIKSRIDVLWWSGVNPDATPQPPGNGAFPGGNVNSGFTLPATSSGVYEIVVYTIP